MKTLSIKRSPVLAISVLLLALLAPGSAARASAGTIVYSTYPPEERGPDQDLYSVDARGNHLKRLTSTPDLNENNSSLSPHGKRLLFSWDRDLTGGSTSRIVLMHTDGSHRRGLGIEGYTPRFSPSGDRFLYGGVSRHHGLCVMRFKGKKHYCVKTKRSDNSFSWAPDGKQIVFARYRDVWIMRADGSNQHRLLPKTGRLHEYEPFLSPNGKWVLYGGNTNDWEMGRRSSSEVYLSRVDSGRKWRLTKDGALDDVQGFSPGGRRVLFVSNRSHPSRFNAYSDVYTMDLRGRHAKRITHIGTNSNYAYSATWGR